MLLFNQKTGQPIAVILDEGFLTDIRTAAAGALVAKYFAPKEIRAIGIIGTGIQAKLQLEYLQKNNPCKMVWVWGRNANNVQKFKEEIASDFNVHIAKNPSEVAKNSTLIVTTTPSEIPLLFAKDIQPGTHITAVGSDTSEKQELGSDILGKADFVISDSIPQSKSRGEIYKATKNGTITPEKVVELGKAIQDISLQRMDAKQITVADLTGVAVQDIMITKAVYLNYMSKTNEN
jgi:ornithine cyclodeaminase